MGSFHGQLMRKALDALGHALRADVELLVVGGGAGLLTGELPNQWTTSDVDAVEFRPPDEVEEVLRAAAEVARAMSLPANWLNLDAGLYRHDLPAQWKRRRVHVGDFGRLTVFALGRLDLIATKFFAHRTTDRAHLEAMHVTPRELAFVRRYLRERAKDDPRKAATAMAYVEAWNS